MSVDRVEFDRRPPEPELSIWQDWMRQHGVDPNDVAVPGWIERHLGTYRLVYEAYDLDENGRPRWDREHDDAVRVARVFQMEAPPLPFPSLPRSEGGRVSRIWPPPPLPEPSLPEPSGPRVSVPFPAHARLRDRLVEIYGLDDGCSDDAILLAALEHAPP